MGSRKSIGGNTEIEDAFESPISEELKMAGALYCLIQLATFPASFAQELDLVGPDLVGMSLEEMSEKLLKAASNPHPDKAGFLFEGLNALMAPRESDNSRLLPENLSPRNSGEVFHSVLKALASVADERLLDDLEDQVDSKIRPLGFAAIQLAGIIGGNRAVKILKPLLKSDDRQQRTVAILALGDTASAQAMEVLDGLKNESDMIVVRFALERLRRQTGRSEIPVRGQKTGRLLYSGLQKKPDLREWQIESEELDEKKLTDQMNGSELIVLGRSENDESSSGVTRSLGTFVRGGGTLLLRGTNDAFASTFRALGMTAPSQWDEKDFRCMPWLPDFHPVVSSVFELDDVYPEFTANGGWKNWSKEQRAPLRSPDGTGASPLIYQTLGKGMVILSAVDLLGDYFFRTNLLATIYGPEYRKAKSFVWTMSESWETPHRKWGKPLAGGALRVLFLMPRIHKRSVVEMSQRLDLEYSFLPLLTEQTKGAKKGSETKSEFTVSGEVIDELESQLGRPWDVLVIGQTFIQGTGYYQRFGWREFPERLKRMVATKVREGRGLVFAPARVPGAAVGGVPVLAGSKPAEPDSLKFHLPFFSANSVELRTLAKGRIAFFDQNLPCTALWEDFERVAPAAFQVPAIERWRVVYPIEEYSYAGLAKTLLWSAGRSDKGQLASIGGDYPEFLLALKTAADGLTADIQIRDRFNRVVYKTALPVGEKGCRISPPALFGGAFVLEVVLRDSEKRSTDWGAISFHVPNKDSVVSVEQEAKSYAEGSTARVKVNLTIERAQALVWQVHDTWGRVTQQGKEVAAKSLELEIPFLHPLSRLHYLWLELQGEAGSPLAVQRLPLLVRTTEPSDFRWYQAGGGSKGLIEQLGAAGVDCIGLPDSASVVVDQALENNIGFWSAWSGIGAGYPGRGNADGTGHSICSSGPAFRTMLRRNFEEKCPRASHFGINLFMLQDESEAGIGHCDLLPCVAAYREHLRGQYDSLEALNASWKTSFKRWEEVNRLPAKSPQVLAPAIDHMHFMRRLYADWIDESQGGIRRLIPEARVGFSVSWGDAWELSRFLSATMWHRHVMHYDDHISYGRPETVFGSWYGPTYNKSDRNEAQARHETWAPLFGGANAFFEWWGARQFSYNFVRPDLSLFNIAKVMSEEVGEIKSGIGKMLIDAEYVTSPFVLYDSPRSRSALSALEKLSAKGRRTSSLKAVRSSLRKMQIPIRYLHSEQVEDGLLTKDDIRIVYMSQAVSLSDTEIRELTQFVQQGGILITDYDAGLRDERGNTRSIVPAEQLFGIRYEQDGGSDLGGALKLAVDFEELKFAVTESSLSPSSWGANIEATDGKALGTINGRTPAFIVNRLGKGTAIFLNFDPGQVDAGTGETFIHKMCDALISKAGIKMPFKVVGGDGSFPKLRLGTFKRGSHRFIGFSADPDGDAIEDQQKMELTLHSSEKGYLYDVRHGNALGRNSEVSLVLTPGIAKVYSLLPYQVAKVAMLTEPSTSECGGVIRIRVSIHADGEIGDHVLHIQVFDPDGKQRREHQRNVTAIGGEITFSLPVALNDSLGRWRVVAKDVATGMSGQTEFLVR
ncbi:MAG: beta-galactosidase [Planctomycetota bacterium]|nr:beta-galactosidase [Planctomycetota bacterium]